MTELPILSFVIWLPIIGGLLVLASGDRLNPRPLSLAVAMITFLTSLLLYSGFDSSTADMQFEEKASWIPVFKIFYHLGIDGISMPLIILTTFTTVLVVLAGWEVIKDRPAQYMAAFLIMEGLMNGVFAALDAMLFYVFWEGMLIPMFPITMNCSVDERHDLIRAELERIDSVDPSSEAFCRKHRQLCAHEWL